MKGKFHSVVMGAWCLAGFKRGMPVTDNLVGGNRPVIF